MNITDLLVTDCAIIKKSEVLSVYTDHTYVITWGNQTPVYNIYAKTDNDGDKLLYSHISQENLSTTMNALAVKLTTVSEPSDIKVGIGSY